MSAILAEALGQTATLLFVGLIVFAFHGKGQRRTIVEPKFSSWSLIPANFGRCFHAISARYWPIVQLKRITKWVSHY